MAKQRCLLLFENGIKSEATKKAYHYQLTKFRDWVNVKEFSNLLEGSDKDIQIMLEDYVMDIKSRISPNSIPIYLAPIEHFYVMNDKNLNFKKIRKLFPEKVKKGNERGYTLDEIRLILDNCKNKRQKSLVLLLASSGVRLGAIPDMKIRHMTKINDTYAILIYEGDVQEDYIFTTPEASLVIDSYIDERKKRGEIINEDSPLFRSDYQIGSQTVIQMNTDSLAHLMNRLVSVVNRRRIGKTKRFDVARNHGFRKFFATTIKDTVGITPTMTEKLINHIGVTQLDGAYYKPSVKKMYDSYKKAIPDLTLSNEQRDHLKIEALQKEVDTIENLKTRLEIVEKQKNDFALELQDKSTHEIKIKDLSPELQKIIRKLEKE